LCRTLEAELFFTPVSLVILFVGQESANYPLSSPGPQGKRFRMGLFELVRVLVSSCQNSLLYDDYLFSSLLDLLIGLSDSQVRAFRHTSTLLGESQGGRRAGSS